VSAEWIYTGFYRWNHRRHVSVGDSAGESGTSLYDYPGLNPSVIPSIKSSEKIHVITPLQLSKKTVSSVGDTVGTYRWHTSSVYTDRITDSLYLLVNTDRFGDGIISVCKNFRRKNSISNSVGFLWFSCSEIPIEKKHSWHPFHYLTLTSSLPSKVRRLIKEKVSLGQCYTLK